MGIAVLANGFGFRNTGLLPKVPKLNEAYGTAIGPNYAPRYWMRTERFVLAAAKPKSCFSLSTTLTEMGADATETNLGVPAEGSPYTLGSEEKGSLVINTKCCVSTATQAVTSTEESAPTKKN